jgi:hypothetical protein
VPSTCSTCSRASGTAHQPLSVATASRSTPRRFPIPRDLPGSDFTHAKVDRRQTSSFATTVFAEQAGNIVLIGGTGTGNESHRFRHSSHTATRRIKSRERARLKSEEVSADTADHTA